MTSETPPQMDRPVKRSFFNRHRKMLAGGALAIVIIAGTAWFSVSFSTRTARVSLDNLTVSPVTQGAYHDFIPLRGKAVAHDVVLLDALEGGRVDAVLVQSGDTVLKGQPLVTLSNSTLALDVLEREARIIESITQLQSYQTSLEQGRLANDKALADIDYNIDRLDQSLNRREKLAATGAEPVELLSQVQTDLAYQRKIRPMQEEGNAQQSKLRAEQLPQIQDQIVKLQKDLVITHDMLGNLIIRAPVDGRLTALNVKVGENRNSGENVGEITRNTGFKVLADVDEYYLGRLKTGQIASMQVGERTMQMRVTRIDPQVTNGTFSITLEFVGASPTDLTPGQALQGKLALGADVTTRILPAGAFLERTGGAWVFVVAADGHSAQRRDVKIGRRNNEQVEILDGLKPGDQVITSDYAGLQRVDRVDFQK